MKEYWILAQVYFNVEAKSEEEAREQVAELLEELLPTTPWDVM